MKINIMHHALLLFSGILFGTACSDNTTDDTSKLRSISVDPPSFTMAVGTTQKLTAAAVPSTAPLDGIGWNSRNTAIVTIDSDGTVRAVGEGMAVIVATCGDAVGTSTVTVKGTSASLESITLSAELLTLEKSTSHQLTAKLSPEGVVHPDDITWSSSAASVADIDGNGKITALADGHATITAAVGDVSAVCRVEVYTKSANRVFTFYQLNIWEGLANIANGQQAFIDQLVALKPDAASFCEFPSGESARTILGAAAAALEERTGIPYYYNYRSGSGTRGILTRHPIISSDAVGGNAWFYRTVIDFYGQEIALYASHSNYLYYACYLPRGYGDGSNPYTWAELTPEQAAAVSTDVPYILEREELSGRTKIAVDLIADGKVQSAAGRLCIFGGDLNQPSHLDWTEAAKDLFEHNGCVVPWPVSTTLYGGEFRDAFREVYPNPVTHPGITWPVSNKDAKKVTQWAANADERDRIDYVYYRLDSKVSAVKAQMVGPAATIANSQIVNDAFADKSAELIEPAGGLWPSDHRGLFITFSVGFPQ